MARNPDPFLLLRQDRLCRICSVYTRFCRLPVTERGSDGMEALPDDLARIRDQQERVGRILFNKISEPHRLHPVQHGEDNIFVVPGKSAFCVYDGRAPVQAFFNKITDWLRGGADHVEVFRQVQALDES